MIQIFAYAGYKRDVHGRFVLLFVLVLFFFLTESSGTCGWIFVAFFSGARLTCCLLSGARLRLASRRILPCCRRRRGRASRCQGDQPVVPILRGRDGARLFSTTRSERAGLRHVQARGTSSEAVQEGRREKGSRNSLSLSFNLGFV